MLAFFKRLGIGFTYGLGFALGVTGLVALTVGGGAGYLATTGHGITVSSSGVSEPPRINPDQFVISDTSAVKTEWGSLSILGTIHNTGDDTPRYVNVYADLYDKNGKFIFQCMHQFNAGLRKAEKANFMIECHGMPKELVPNYQRYEVYARAFQ